jgi:hypothetical protein
VKRRRFFRDEGEPQISGQLSGQRSDGLSLFVIAFSADQSDFFRQRLKRNQVVGGHVSHIGST